MSDVQKMVEAHFKVENLNRSKADVAEEYGVSPRTLGRWLDKVNSAREAARTNAELKNHVRIEEHHRRLEGTVSKGSSRWTYINPKPTANADLRQRRASGAKTEQKKPWPSKSKGLSKSGEAKLHQLADRFSH